MMIFSGTFIPFFFLLIIITGFVATSTDLRHKKIRNSHLSIIAIAAIILVIIKALSDKSLPMLQLVSTGCAIIIAWVFYKNDLWRGGDAKLFVAFSFLMPATGYESRIFLPSIALFCTTFISALIFLGLWLFRDFCVNPKAVIENIFKALKRYHLHKAIGATFKISWVIFPLFRACGLAQYGVLSFLGIYLISIYASAELKKLIVHNKFLTVAALVGGLLLHVKFLPDILLWKNFLFYLCIVVVYPVLMFILSSGINFINKSPERVPFAPFLFLGCLLSYTPFLTLIASLQRVIRS